MCGLEGDACFRACDAEEGKIARTKAKYLKWEQLRKDCTLLTARQKVEQGKLEMQRAAAAEGAPFFRVGSYVRKSSRFVFSHASLFLCKCKGRGVKLGQPRQEGKLLIAEHRAEQAKLEMLCSHLLRCGEAPLG